MVMTAYRSYGYETILNPRSCCPYTGKETVTLLSNGIKLFIDENGSYRFVMYISGRSVSALQIMKQKELVRVANVITVKKHRQKGYAKIVWAEAKKMFPHIEHSHHLSPEGKIFSEKCN